MTKPKSKQATPQTSESVQQLQTVPPLVLKNPQSKEKLRSLIRAAFGKGDLPYGLSGIEYRLLRAANQARIVYETASREISQVRQQIEYLENNLPNIIDSIRSLTCNHLIKDQHWKETIDELRENAEFGPELDLSPEDVANLKNAGCKVFEPEMVENFPLQSTRYGLELTLEAVRKQLSALEQDYEGLSIADRPETEVLAHTIRDIQKDVFPDKPNYIGSPGGDTDRLYEFLCEIAGYSSGCGISTLRKPYSLNQVDRGKRFAPFLEAFRSRPKENGES